MDARSFIVGGGIPSASFDKIGTTIGGEIVDEPELQQQKDFDSGALLFWDDGKPRMQLVVTVQTDLRDPAVEDDDGQRRFYIRSNMRTAVNAATRAAGATKEGLLKGGHLYITYVGDGEQKRKGLNAPKMYEAHYTRPSAAYLANTQGAQQYAPAQPAYIPQGQPAQPPAWAQPPAQAPAQPVQQPAQPAPAASAGGAGAPTGLPAGLTPDMLAALTPEAIAMLQGLQK